MTIRLAAILILLASTPTRADTTIAADYSSDTFKVCYDFSCRSESEVRLSENDWRGIRNMFFPPAQNAREERLRIQKAIGLMEIMVGKYTPTYQDAARNAEYIPNLSYTRSGQLDCVDEAINSTTYLRLFAARGLLRYHHVLDRAYRRSLLNQHWAARVVENASGEHFIFDSWFGKNGEPPYVVRGDVWYSLSIFDGRNADPKARLSVSLNAER